MSVAFVIVAIGFAFWLYMREKALLYDEYADLE